MSELNQKLIEKQNLIKKVPRWFHSIDCGDGIVTPGRLSLETLKDIWLKLNLPSLNGKSVLDIGAWDGFYSFAAKEAGAEKVVALDHFTWLRSIWLQESAFNHQYIDWQRPNLKSGTFPGSKLDGKLGFDTVNAIKGNKVESVVGDFMTMDLLDIGKFDIVFFMGVLYHLKDPLTALRRLSLVTGQLAVIETQAIYVPGFEDIAMFEFYEKDELNKDPTNWWAPNVKGLETMCKAAGFRNAKCVAHYPPLPPKIPNGSITRYRLIVHAS